MLESHKIRIYERRRLRAMGVSDAEIEKIQHRPFKPAFVAGRRQERSAEAAEDEGRVPTGQFAFRRER